MASSYTTNFGIEEMATGDQSGAWGTTTNYNFDILDRVASYTSVALSGTTHTLTVRAASPTSGSSNVQDGMYRVIKFTGALGANNTVTIGPNTSKAYFIFINATTDSGSSGPYSVILSQGSGANVTIANGKSTLVYCDGAGSGAAVVDALANLQLSSLIVNGVVTDDGAVHDGDVTFTGASYNVVWDKSDNALEFADNAKATFGAGGDLSIYHNGTNSYVDEAGTGNLYIRSNEVRINKYTGEYMAKFVADGAVTLYHDNSSKLATTSAGVDVTGTVTMDGGATSADFSFGDDDKALFGAGNDLQIYHDGSNSYILENGTGNLIAKGNAGIYLRGTNDEEMATFLQDGAVTLYHDNTARIATTSAGVDVTGTVTDDGATHDGDVTLTGSSYNVVWDKSDNSLEFADNAKAVFGTGGDLSIFHDGSSSVIRDSGTGNLAIQAEDFAVQSADASATHIFVDSSSGYTSLAYGGSAKIATSASGVDVTGTVTDDGATHDGDVTLTGASYNVVWDKSDNALEFGDNAKAIFGAGNDLEIYHDASNSYIDEGGTGSLIIKATQLILKTAADEISAYFTSDGAATLYHNNSVKLATTSTGVDVTGTVTMDGGSTSANFEFGDDDKATFGAGADLKIWHSGSTSYIQDAGTGSLYIDTDGTDVSIISDGSYANGKMATFVKDGAVTLYHDNTARVTTTSTGAAITGNATVGDTVSAYLDIGGDLSTGNARVEIGTGRSGSGYSWLDLVGDTTYTDYGLRIMRYQTGANAPSTINHRGTGDLTIKSTEAADILFETTNLERMRIQAGGYVGIGTTSPAVELVVRGSTPQVRLEPTSDAQNTRFEFATTDGTLQTSIQSGGSLGPDIQFVNSTTSNIRVMIKADGKVGIGTTAPTTRLQVGDNTVSLENVVKFGERVATSQTNLPLIGQHSHDGAGNGLGINATSGSGAIHFFTGNNASGFGVGDNSEQMRISAAGIVSQYNQPAFQAMPSANQSDIATDTWTTIALGSERFDVAGNFASNVFTAPTNGKYMLTFSVRFENVDAAALYYYVALATSNESYYNIVTVPGTGDVPYLSREMSIVADMDASDTAYLRFYQSGGTAQTDIDVQSWFSGYLLG